MDQNLLVTGQIEAGAEFALEFDNYLPVSVAFWVLPAQSDSLYLYIACDKLDGNKHEAYGEVWKILNGPLKQWITLFQIKLLSTNDWVAKAAIQARESFAEKVPARYRGSSLGGLEIEAAYIYPSLASMKSSTP
jgi:hypothetical protein